MQFETFHTVRPGCRLHEAGDVEPFEAMVAERDRALTFRRPYAARDRLQADAMLIRRPDLDGGVRMLVPLLRRRPLKLFLSAVRPFLVAASG